MENKKSGLFFNGWKTVAIFLLILIFQPANLTFLAFRPSDFWLWVTLYFQYSRRRHPYQDAPGYSLAANFGLYMGILAIVATVIQAAYIRLGLEPAFLALFYKFFRYYLIFRMIRNISWEKGDEDYRKLFRFLTIIASGSLAVVFLEFNDIQPFASIIHLLYIDKAGLNIKIILDVDVLGRAGGILGNSNASGMLLTASLVYSYYFIIQKNAFFKKLLLGAFFFVVIYVEFVYLGSRTALISILLIPLVSLIVRARSLYNILNTVVIFVVLMYAGNVVFEKYMSYSETQVRIKQTFEEGNLYYSSKTKNEWTPRVEMWNERVKTLIDKGNPVSPLIGLGYTKVYRDYADNGLVSCLVNNGLIGLVLKIGLLYGFFILGARILFGRRKKDFGITAWVLYTICLILLAFEISADLFEHYRLGQLFYLFFSVLYWHDKDKTLPVYRRVRLDFV